MFLAAIRGSPFELSRGKRNDKKCGCRGAKVKLSVSAGLVLYGRGSTQPPSAMWKDPIQFLQLFTLLDQGTDVKTAGLQGWGKSKTTTQAGR